MPTKQEIYSKVSYIDSLGKKKAKELQNFYQYLFPLVKALYPRDTKDYLEMRNQILNDYSDTYHRSRSKSKECYS